MRLVTTLYSSKELDFIIGIQPKARKDSDGNWTSDDSMLVPYQSKVGNMSLIFNPTVSLRIKPNSWDVKVDPASIPSNLIYRFNASLTQVYNNALAKGTYRDDEGLFLDPKVMATTARRLSLFKGSLTIFPDIMTGADNTPLRSITFQIDKQRLGSLPLPEVSALIDLIDHLDLATYLLVAGIMEEIDDLKKSNQIVLGYLDRIEQLLKSGQQYQKPAPERSNHGVNAFSWQSGPDIYKLGS